MNQIVLAAVVLIAAPDATSLARLAEPLAETIVKAGAHRVAVVPPFPQRDEGRSTLAGPGAGSAGPQGIWLPERLAQDLAEQAKGRFRVVENALILRSMIDLKLSPDDLESGDGLRRLTERVGRLDALILGRTEDRRDPPAPGQVVGRLRNIDIACRVLDPRSGVTTGRARYRIDPSLALRIYRGDAHELDIDAVRTIYPRPLQELASKGANLPGGGFSRPISIGGGGDPIEQPEPNVKPEDLLSLWITVDGKVRDFVPIVDPGSRETVRYAPIEPGESYEIQMESRFSGLLYGVVYVDGINILGKKRDLGPKPRYWYLAPQSKFVFRGWYIGGPPDYTQERFVIVPADESDALKIDPSSAASRDLGLITVAIYLPTRAVVGENPIIANTGPGAKSLEVSKFATGSLPPEAVDLKQNDRSPPRGRQIGGYSIRYAPRSQIEKLKSRHP
jgi:hypothetical protein